MPFGFGAKVVLTCPVVALNAKRFRRAMSVELPALRTVVKVPPTMIRFPTWVIVTTAPSITWGVKPSGLSLTIRPVCGALLPVLAAVAGRPTAAPAIAVMDRSSAPMSVLRTTYSASPLVWWSERNRVQ